MAFGLTATGFVRKRLPDIKDEIEATLIAVFGEINVASDSLWGQWIGIEADREAQIWELLEELYYAMYPASAEGVQLDGVAQMVGVERIPASSSSVIAALLGNEGTNVPAGTEVSIDGTDEVFETLIDVEITEDAVIACIIGIQSGLTGATYSVELEGTTFSVVGGGGGTNPPNTPTDAQVVDSLMIEISTPVGITTTDLGDYLEITADDFITAFQVDDVLNTNMAQIESPALFQAQNTGPVLALVETLTEIVTPVGGLTSVTNYIEGDLGRDVETDTELRVRRSASLATIGAGTVEAIRARLLNDVEGVTAAFVYDNRTDAVDGDGRPPHSFEAIVEGGTDLAVAEKIWEVKPAGIAMFRNAGGTGVTQNITDSQGDVQAIKFSRPSDQEIWVEIEYNTTGSEEDFPTDGDATIKANVLAFGNTFEIGQDVLVQQFISIGYSVGGVTTVVARIREGQTPGGAGFTSNLAIATAELAVFENAHILITDVTP